MKKPSPPYLSRARPTHGMSAKPKMFLKDLPIFFQSSFAPWEVEEEAPHRSTAAVQPAVLCSCFQTIWKCGGTDHAELLLSNETTSLPFSLLFNWKRWHNMKSMKEKERLDSTGWGRGGPFRNVCWNDLYKTQLAYFFFWGFLVVFSRLYVLYKANRCSFRSSAHGN